MGRVNVLTVEGRTGPGRPHLVAAEFVIDGRPLLEHCERVAGRAFDLVSPFGWTAPDHQRAAAERLLLARPPALPTGRRELLVCPECAGLGCGCVSAAVRREGGYYVWSEIGYETDYDPDGLRLFPMGGFVFAADELAHLLAGRVAGLR